MNLNLCKTWLQNKAVINSNILLPILLFNFVFYFAVFCLPGRCFNIENYMRIVLTVPQEMIVEACQRIKEFCEKHFVTNEEIICRQFTNSVQTS